jgi:hypothetical protein
MAKVFLRSLSDDWHDTPDKHSYPVRLLRESADLDPFGVHTVVDNPQEADLIIYAESHRNDTAAGLYHERVLTDHVYRKYPNRCAIHLGIDRPIPMLPGIYPSIEQRWCNPRTRSGCYLVEKNQYLRHVPLSNVDRVKWLGSFQGNANGKPIRQQLLGLQSNQVKVADRGHEFIKALRSNDYKTVKHLKQEYIEASVQSKFVLCPRGTGASSIRLFEALEMGRAPVIISDAWVQPIGPDWSAFSIRVPEHDIAHIPEILAQFEPQAIKMGALAHEAWLKWYSKKRIFHRVTEDCIEVLKNRLLPQYLRRWLFSYQRLRPVHLIPTLRKIRKQFRARAQTH